jgi:CspA family cold shock protein
MRRTKAFRGRTAIKNGQDCAVYAVTKKTFAANSFLDSRTVVDHIESKTQVPRFCSVLRFGATSFKVLSLTSRLKGASLPFQGMSMQTGIVKWFNSDKGYGFIMPESGGKDLFAHSSEIEGGGATALVENQRVSFEIGQGAKGPQATNIRVL